MRFGTLLYIWQEHTNVCSDVIESGELGETYEVGHIHALFDWRIDKPQ
jgi:hypothetical protein